MTPSDDTSSPAPLVRSGSGSRQVRRGAGQAHDRGPRGPLRPAPPTDRFAEYTGATRSRRSSSVTPSPRTSTLPSSARGCRRVTVGAKLREQGLGKVVLIDKAGGIGGTWYWNRYPGIMCDVESYIYIPMLEEMGYVPTTRYVSVTRSAAPQRDRDEVRSGRRRAVLHRGRGRAVGRATSRWSDRDPPRRGPGARPHPRPPGSSILMKLPAIPAWSASRAASSHTGPLGLRVHGRWPRRSRTLDKLADKVVGVSGAARARSSSSRRSRSRRSTCTCSSGPRRRSVCGAIGRPARVRHAPAPRVAEGAHGELQRAFMIGRPVGARPDRRRVAHHTAESYSPNEPRRLTTVGEPRRWWRRIDFDDHGGAPAWIDETVIGDPRPRRC